MKLLFKKMCQLNLQQFHHRKIQLLNNHSTPHPGPTYVKV